MLGARPGILDMLLPPDPTPAAYASIRQHPSAYNSILDMLWPPDPTPAA
jgi:hypothetical protein